MQGKIYLLHGLQAALSAKVNLLTRSLTAIVLRSRSDSRGRGSGSDRPVLVDRTKHEVDLPVNLRIRLGERFKNGGKLQEIGYNVQLRPI